MRQLAVSLVLCVLSLAASIARAAPSDVDAREREALAACDTRQTGKGIDLLGRLYAETLEPIYLYNQGRCYQKGGLPADALNRFREFLRVIRDPKHELVADARRFVAELEAVTFAPTRSGPATPDASVALAEPPRDGRQKTLLVAGVALLGLGAAGLVTGVVLGVKAKRAEADLKKGVEGPAPAWDGREVNDRLRSGERLETWQWIAYLTGAAAVTGAGVCLYLGARSPTESAALGTVTLAPLWGPAPGAALAGRF